MLEFLQVCLLLLLQNLQTSGLDLKVSADNTFKNFLRVALSRLNVPTQ